MEVYLVSPPVLRELYQDPAYREYLDSIADSLKMFADGSPRIHVLLDTPPLFNADEMQTLNHVIGTAAPDYTREVCEAIRAAVRATREVAESVWRCLGDGEGIPDRLAPGSCPPVKPGP